MGSAALATEPFVSITTFRRDGSPVSVPVWCADNGALLVFSAADSWTMKRIRRDAHVRLAPCSARGKPRGPAIDADASLVEETAKVKALLAQKNSTYTRRKKTVSTVKKSQATIPVACWRRNDRQLVWTRRGAGSRP